MCIFRIFLVLIFFVVIQADIPLDEVDTGLYGHPTFENIVKESLNEVAEKIKAINDLTRATGSSINFIPEVGSKISDFLVRLAAAETETMWEDALIKGIADATERAVASGRIEDMRATINAILHHFRNLKTVELTDSDRRTIVHQIYNEYLKTINAFTPTDSVFRKYPDLALVPLSTFADISVLFFPLLADFVPSLANDTILPCRLKDALRDYRSLHTYQRFQKLVGEHWDPNAGFEFCWNYHLSSFYGNILVRTHENNRDMISNDPIRCEKIPKCYQLWPMNNRPERYTITDPITEITYSCDSNNQFDCMARYMGLLRYRIEDAYNKPIDLMKKVCTEAKQNKRKPTGSGWLIVWVISAYGKYLVDGSQCDALLGVKMSVCDMYVRFLIDGKEDFRTTVETDPDDAVSFKKTYTTKKLSKNAIITIELKDEDNSDDDFLGKYTDSVENFIGLREFKVSPWLSQSSTVQMITFWKGEYENEIQ